MTLRFRSCNPRELVDPALRDRVITTCNLCSHPGPFTLLAIEEPGADPLEHLVGAHAQRMTVSCPACGWTFKPGRLSVEQLRTLYGRQGGDATVNSATRATLDSRSRDVKRHIEAVAGREFKDCKVLDIGGGAGQVSVSFAEAGASVEILELGGATPLHPSAHVHQTSFDDFTSRTVYDLIIMSHVLEHTWTPAEWLVKAERLLAPAGVLFVEVPFEFYTPYAKGKLGDPCHVGYFGRATLADFIAKAGLEARSLVRMLAGYDARRVMALRAVCVRAAASGISIPPRRNALLSALAEMANPKQLMLAMCRR